MTNDKKYVALAVNGGIGIGAQLKPKQLVVLGEYLDEDTEIELTTLKQLVVQVPMEQNASSNRSCEGYQRTVIDSSDMFQTTESHSLSLCLHNLINLF